MMDERTISIKRICIFLGVNFLNIQYSTVFEEELKKIIASLPGEEALSDIPAMFLMELLIAYGMVDGDGYVCHFVNAKAEDVMVIPKIKKRR